MNASDSFFSETNSKTQHKLCGNCARVSFGLNKEEAEFLVETIKFYGLITIRNWLKKKGTIKMVGGSKAPDLEKMRVMETILKHKRFCGAAGVDVFCIDTPCFLWQPEPACTLSPQENNSIRQRVLGELQKNPTLTPKMLCLQLGLAWPEYRACVSQTCTEHRCLIQNKGYLGRIRRDRKGVVV